jgi:DHA2 family multidrug resistance protein-like MFS transporter
MKNKWLILSLIILIYLPIAIDATVLLVTLPRLSLQLSATNNELLWITDIYSLIMAGMLLPMGSLGDRFGFKKTVLIGSVIFGIGSLAAAFSESPMSLILSRGVLAIGAAMILPATLAALRHSFTDEKSRGIALGIWAAFGTGAAAAGPLVGGIILEYFDWGMVFLINIPIVIVVIISVFFVLDEKVLIKTVEWKLFDSVLIITGLLLFVYGVKSTSHGSNVFIGLALVLIASLILFFFIRRQRRLSSPLFDLTLFKIPVISIGVLMALTAMIVILGFELLFMQELQFTLGMTPFESSKFMLPFILSAIFAGPIAGWLLSVCGLRVIATIGMGLSSLSFFGLAFTDINGEYHYIAFWMVILGLSADIALLAGTAAIMNAAPLEKAAMAGAIESFAYEIGSVIGIILFGLLLSEFYSYLYSAPEIVDVSKNLLEKTRNSIGEALQVASVLDSDESRLITSAAKSAFSVACQIVLVIAGVMLLMLTLIVWVKLKANGRSQQSNAVLN